MRSPSKKYEWLIAGDIEAFGYSYPREASVAAEQIAEALGLAIPALQAGFADYHGRDVEEWPVTLRHIERKGLVWT